MAYCPVCASSSYGKCADHRDEVVFRDRYFITVDLDPETEANVRRSERHSLIDAIIEALGDQHDHTLPDLIRLLHRLRG